MAAGLITWHRVDDPDPLVIPQRRFAEPGAAGDLLDGQPSCLIESGSCHAPIMQNLKCFKAQHVIGTGQGIVQVAHPRCRERQRAATRKGGQAQVGLRPDRQPTAAAPRLFRTSSCSRLRKLRTRHGRILGWCPRTCGRVTTPEAAMIVITGGNTQFGGLVAGDLLDHLQAGQVTLTVREPRKAGPLKDRGADVRHADAGEPCIALENRASPPIRVHLWFRLQPFRSCGPGRAGASLAARRDLAGTGYRWRPACSRRCRSGCCRPSGSRPRPSPHCGSSPGRYR